MSVPAIDLAQVQRRRKHLLKGVVAALVASLLVTSSAWAIGGEVHELVEDLGVALILICIVGRTWSSLYIGGRKSSRLVDRGPYSVVRNPLYLFSIVGAVGVGAQFGSIIAMVGGGLICWAVFRVVATREEEALTELLGEPYSRYKARVPRFLPDIRLWRDEAELVVRPRLVVATLFDALFFLLSIPIAEAVELAQSHGYLTVLFRLP